CKHFENELRRSARTTSSTASDPLSLEGKVFGFGYIPCRSEILRRFAPQDDTGGFVLSCHSEPLAKNL
ncbi:MAG: hypothetical protein IKF65_02905, partial [Clostridia bacterium]|nr:hypothetical protein [Clostridia bacterium]